MAQTGGLRWVQRFLCGQTSTGRDCGFWLDRQRMPIRPDGSLHLRRSMTVVRVQMPPGWAV
ncbi:hypothetical protein SMRU11_01245 (plasmid) [Sinorhizobium meliloti RU11/001]|nr:hypothetical protein SMRU11_01245 [Sinorhizobium meliloti RU11/001]